MAQLLRHQRHHLDQTNWQSPRPRPCRRTLRSTILRHSCRVRLGRNQNAPCGERSVGAYRQPDRRIPRASETHRPRAGSRKKGAARLRASLQLEALRILGQAAHKQNTLGLAVSAQFMVRSVQACAGIASEIRATRCRVKMLALAVCHGTLYRSIEGGVRCYD